MSPKILSEPSSTGHSSEGMGTAIHELKEPASHMHNTGQIGVQTGTVHNHGNMTFNYRGDKEDQRRKLRQELAKSEKENRKDQNPARVPGTCEWFTTHPTFQGWRASPSSNILWISADPGSGKSVLARHLIDNVLPTPGSRICYFFFKDNSEQTSATVALCCILNQIFTAAPFLLCEKIIDRFENTGESFFSSFIELWNAFLIAARNENAGNIICVLDALDECKSSDRSRLISKLKELYGNPTDISLKFLVTSRPIREIVHALRPLEIPESFLIHLNGDGDEEKKMISQEIDVFIDSRVREISTKLPLGNGERGLLSERLKCTENRTYLWVYLILDLIEKGPNISIGIDRDVINNVTSQLPVTVDEAYERILSTSCKNEEAKRLLQIVVAAIRPLTLEELYVAFTLSHTQTTEVAFTLENHRSYDSLKTNLGPEEIRRFGYDVRDRCGLFVRIVDSRIYLIYQTAKEFLVRREAEESLLQPAQRSTAWKDSLRMRSCHQLLADVCMQHLLKFPEFEADPFTRSTNLSYYIDKYPLVEYSAKHWAIHLKESQADLDDVTAIQSICELCDTATQRCLTWLRIYWTSTNTEFPEKLSTLMAVSYFGFAPAVTHLLKSNYDDDLDRRDYTYERSALSWAAGNGCDVVVTQLLKGSPWKGILHLPFIFRGANIDSVDKYGRTPLTYAILNKWESVADQLLRAGARADLEDNIEGTPFYYAVCSGWKSLATRMLKGGREIGLGFSLRARLFFSAVERGHNDVVKLLLEEGEINVGERDLSGHTALMLAAERGHEVVMQLLLDSGADVEAENGGRKALQFAVSSGRKSTVQLLLDSGAIRTKEKTISAALMFATGRGYGDMVELLLDRGAYIEVKDGEGRTPLAIAAKFGEEKVVKLLLDRGAKVEARDKVGQTPLAIAARYGSDNAINLLLDRGTYIEVKDNRGRTPLGTAAESGKEKVVKLLLDRGAKVEVKDNAGRTPLALATAVYYRNDNVIILLLDKGANIEAKDFDDRTPLLIAIKYRSKTSVELLLDRGANFEVSLKEDKDRTPLAIIISSKYGWEDMVSLLLDKGANVEATGNDGWTPLGIAARNGYRDIVNLLLDKGANIEAGNIHETPLLIAARAFNRELVELLLDRGANIEAKGFYSRTPLLTTMQYGHLGREVVELLLDRGADVEAKDNRGRTPLVVAVSWPDSRAQGIVEMLLGHGANVEAKDMNGDTALSLAVKRKNGDVAQLLIKNGADITAENNGGVTPLRLAFSYEDWRATMVRWLAEADDRYSYLLSDLPGEGKGGGEGNEKDAVSFDPLAKATGNETKEDECGRMPKNWREIYMKIARPPLVSGC
ncbi:hypothetical protein TWF481_003207 [Arthrobotrys musiformis]|uniref:Nephrocystin 3-like N-terminal domain-containing protein n=1 Tax=Arthrobotrys musiformis TaxID=47236 RepID=A0AAV9VPM5_9PEZI